MHTADCRLSSGGGIVTEHESEVDALKAVEALVARYPSESGAVVFIDDLGD